MPESSPVMRTTALSNSERGLLSLLFGSDPIPRALLTEKTSLSQQSVHRLLEGLKKRGFVRFGEPVVNGRGKPSPTVEIDPARYVSVGLSITTEAVHVSILDLSGHLILQYVAEVPPNDPDAVIACVSKDIQSSCGGVLTARDVIGIGVAIQGYRTTDLQCFTAPKLLGRWTGVPIVSTFAKRFDFPIYTENNATASAIAEHYLGAGRGYDCIVYLSFNYGFGGGTVVNGSPLIGQRGNAGELSGLFDLTEMAYRPALGELLKRLNAKDVHLASVSELVAKYDSNWPGVSDWVEEVTPRLALVLRALKVTLDPGAIYFGGDAPPDLRRRLIESVQTDWGTGETPNPVLAESAIEGDASHLGAAFLPLHGLIFG